MLDFSHLGAENSGADVQIFRAADFTPTVVTGMQTWRKPRGKSMCYMLCIGGGAGGGGGFAANAGVGAGGGGGGGSGGMARLLIPAMFIPDVLYISVGVGGTGVTTATGVSGGLSLISMWGATTGKDCILHSHTNAPTGGVSSTNTAGGGAGVGATVAAQSSCNLSGSGLWSAVPGLGGNAGGAQGAVGTNATILAGSGGAVGCITHGGAGGSGKAGGDIAGSSVTAVAGTLLSSIRPTGSAAGATSGSTGILLQAPNYAFMSWPGLGGGASNSVAGGRGGNGGPGSGGGGGGAGTPTGAGNQGRGGDGGHGLVYIICW